MTDYPDFQTPQANATSISLTGVPLLRQTLPLAHGSNVSIGAGSSINPVSTAPLNQPSYEIALGVNLPAAAGTVPFCQIVLQWVDTTLNTVTDTEVFIVSAGNGPGNSLIYVLHGPCRGDALNLLFENLDPAQTMTVSYVVNTTSHVHEYDRLAQFAYAAVAPITFSNPAGNPNTGVLAVINASIAGNTSIQRLCAVWSGTVILSMDNTGQANSISVTIEDPATLYSTVALGHLYKFFLAAGASQTVQLVWPHGPVLISVANNAANAIQPTVTVSRVEY